MRNEEAESPEEPVMVTYPSVNTGICGLSPIVLLQKVFNGATGQGGKETQTRPS